MSKFSFYLGLYATRLGWKRRSFQPVATRPEPIDPTPREICFWTPVKNAGAKIIVHDMLPRLRCAITEAGLPWTITNDCDPPARRVDVLVAFKAIPPVMPQPPGRCVLLICDQVELFWNKLARFDGVVATASRPLAQLLANRHQAVAYIPETETLDAIGFGRANLDRPPSARPRVLMWHGGEYSQGPLNALLPELQNIPVLADHELHIVSGQAAERVERRGGLTLRRLPWSPERLQETAARARLGLAPAHASVRRSWLKPASRIRCMYALGVPAIGDGNVPEVKAFADAVAAPTAGARREWPELLSRMLTDPEQLDRVAHAGHGEVAARHSDAQTAARWINYLGSLFISRA